MGNGMNFSMYIVSCITVVVIGISIFVGIECMYNSYCEKPEQTVDISDDECYANCICGKCSDMYDEDNDIEDTIEHD